jgi:hypothetical protein
MVIDTGVIIDHLRVKDKTSTSLCGILCKWSTVLNLQVASIFKGV